MDLYDGNYALPPRSLVEHNERMNKSMTAFQCNRHSICPDCYLPTKYCEHLDDVDIQPLWRRRK